MAHAEPVFVDNSDPLQIQPLKHMSDWARNQ